MAKYIVYQGYAEKFQWREVEEDGISPITQSDWRNPYDTQDEAVAAVKERDPKAEIELKPIANFNETIEEAEAREAKEAGSSK